MQRGIFMRVFKYFLLMLILFVNLAFVYMITNTTQNDLLSLDDGHYWSLRQIKNRIAYNLDRLAVTTQENIPFYNHKTKIYWKPFGISHDLRNECYICKSPYDKDDKKTTRLDE